MFKKINFQDKISKKIFFWINKMFKYKKTLFKHTHQLTNQNIEYLFKLPKTIGQKVLEFKVKNGKI
jgi:hypothetical protein